MANFEGLDGRGDRDEPFDEGYDGAEWSGGGGIEPTEPADGSAPDIDDNQLDVKFAATQAEPVGEGIPLLPAERAADQAPDVIKGPRAEQTVEDLERVYARHAAVVDRLRSQLEGYLDPRQHPAHMGNDEGHRGQGFYKNVYRLEDPTTGEPLAVKIFKDQNPKQRREQVESQLVLLLRVSDLGTFEHVISASRAEGVLIAKGFQAPIIERAGDEALRSLNVGKLEEVVTDLDLATRRDVLLDRHPGNILLGPNGLCFLDPTSFGSRNPFLANLQTLALSLASAGEQTIRASREERAGALERLVGVVMRRQYPDQNILYELQRILRCTQNGYYL